MCARERRSGPPPGALGGGVGVGRVRGRPRRRRPDGGGEGDGQGANTDVSESEGDGVATGSNSVGERGPSPSSSCAPSSMAACASCGAHVAASPSTLTAEGAARPNQPSATEAAPLSKPISAAICESRAYSVAGLRSDGGAWGWCWRCAGPEARPDGAGVCSTELRRAWSEAGSSWTRRSRRAGSTSPCPSAYSGSLPFPIWCMGAGNAGAGGSRLSTSSSNVNSISAGLSNKSPWKSSRNAVSRGSSNVERSCSGACAGWSSTWTAASKSSAGGNGNGNAGVAERANVSRTGESTSSVVKDSKSVLSVATASWAGSWGVSVGVPELPGVLLECAPVSRPACRVSVKVEEPECGVVPGAGWACGVVGRVSVGWHGWVSTQPGSEEGSETRRRSNP
ncbi:hypothetical protein M427DRAFT_398530 [Gonapodya prolifera JEL478]|uniref:Uncharacterized protein n=1 Tax=Gonapodya prolifera (strain JEL478) TaxID=1344416 RepID=A0A139A659_GONPJ|nr:hypothetical protein M427DRAFT_398530 [Gonapodya prolifera JEL478]|eukprot:KXS12292.1 hypothetical protein M427DRAFT_398530 [Gonapodya prolifera JEL478]